MKETKEIDINELIQDDRNFNQGTEEGQRLMEKSFVELGAGRSILIDKNGRIIAGNKSQLAAIEAGITKVRIVDTTGDELVAVRRTDVDIDSAKGRRLAFADNLTTQINLQWDETELEAVQAEVEGFDLVDFGFEFASDNEQTGMKVEKDNFEQSTSCKFLTIGKNKVPLTDEDFHRFEIIMEEYFKEYGVFIGFGHKLLEAYDKYCKGSRTQTCKL